MSSPGHIYEYTHFKKDESKEVLEKLYFFDSKKALELSKEKCPVTEVYFVLKEIQKRSVNYFYNLQRDQLVMDLQDIEEDSLSLEEKQLIIDGHCLEKNTIIELCSRGFHFHIFNSSFKDIKVCEKCNLHKQANVIFICWDNNCMSEYTPEQQELYSCPRFDNICGCSKSYVDLIITDKCSDTESTCDSPTLD
jgi:hypothetical protein